MAKGGHVQNACSFLYSLRGLSFDLPLLVFFQASMAAPKHMLNVSQTQSIICGSQPKLF
jgi:hypothetical protein